MCSRTDKAKFLRGNRITEFGSWWGVDVWLWWEWGWGGGGGLITRPTLEGI